MLSLSLSQADTYTHTHTHTQGYLYCLDFACMPKSECPIPPTCLFKIGIAATFGHLCCLLTHRPYWRCYYSNTDAIIYVVDSMDRDRIGISKQELVAMLEVKNSLLSLFCQSVCLVVVSCLLVYVSGASPPSGHQGQQYAHCDCE